MWEGNVVVGVLAKEELLYAELWLTGTPIPPKKKQNEKVKLKPQETVGTRERQEKITSVLTLIYCIALNVYIHYIHIYI